MALISPYINQPFIVPIQRTSIVSRDHPRQWRQKNCRKQQLLTDPQHDVKNIFCLKHKYLHLLIYYLSGYFRRGVNFEN
jgi:hypothetical protein